MTLNVLSDDLIIEILCKLCAGTPTVVMSSKKLWRIYNCNSRYIIKKIVNSYNMIFTDISNTLFIKNYNWHLGDGDQRSINDFRGF